MISEAESVLREAVEKMLGECMEGFEDEVDVVYHLCTTTRLNQEEDEERLILNQEMVWWLNLYFRCGDRKINLNGFLPYHYCMDGDVLPMRSLAKALWDQFQFTYLMMGDPSVPDQNIELVLRQIAEEAERGT